MLAHIKNLSFFNTIYQDSNMTIEHYKINQLDVVFINQPMGFENNQNLEKNLNHLINQAKLFNFIIYCYQTKQESQYFIYSNTSKALQFIDKKECLIYLNEAKSHFYSIIPKAKISLNTQHIHKIIFNEKAKESYAIYEEDKEFILAKYTIYKNDTTQEYFYINENNHINTIQKIEPITTLYKKLFDEENVYSYDDYMDEIKAYLDKGLLNIHYSFYHQEPLLLFLIQYCSEQNFEKYNLFSYINLALPYNHHETLYQRIKRHNPLKQGPKRKLVEKLLITHEKNMLEHTLKNFTSNTTPTLKI